MFRRTLFASTLVLTSVAALTPSEALASRRHSSESLQSRIDYGAQPIFDSVVSVASAGNISGSAVLLDDGGDPTSTRWGLFTMHEVGSDLAVRVGTDFNNPLQVIDIEVVIPHPLYVPGSPATQGWDIGVFRLSEPVQGIGGALLYDQPLSIGTQLMFAGYGLHGTGTALDPTWSGMRQGFTAVAGSPVAGVDPQHQNYTWTSNSPPLSGMGALYDSGGAGFVLTQDGFRVAGILDSVLGLGYGGATVWNNVGWGGDDSVASFVANTVPEPSTIALFVLGAPLLARRRASRT